VRDDIRQRPAIDLPSGGVVVNALECKILGPVRVESHGEPVPLVRRRVRHLLGLLLLEVGRPLSTARLVDLLWPDGPPDTGRTRLQTTVSRLRSGLALVDGIDLVRRGDGYVIEVDPETVDAYRFRRLVEQASYQPDPSTRADLARRALALWRGAPLADAGVEAPHSPACAAIDELRQHALDLRIRADLELGRHEALVGELTGMVAGDPLNERAVAHLVLALYRSGRRTDALATCRRARARLADQLGLDPSAELQRMEVAVLRADPSLDLAPAVIRAPSQGISGAGPADVGRDGGAPAGGTAGGGTSAGSGSADRPALAGQGPAAGTGTPVSAQLPPAVADFTGRADQHAELDRLARERGGAARIVVICGLPGVGKTALAVRWAHAARGRFPDGQLFLDLRGYSPEPPLPAVDALGVLLRGLGVRPADLSIDPAELIALFRTVVADRRILLVLDNAHNAEQVRALLPAGTGCLVLVTSRDRLSGLVARDGARRLALDVLAPAESLALLRRVLGAHRVAAELEAATGMAGACGHLPLAVRVAAANLADRPHRSIGEHVAELRASSGFSVLDVEGDVAASTRAAFDLSYRALSGAARRVFRLMALAPGADLSLPGVAALAGVAPGQADRLIGQLCSSHLVRELAPTRYLMHDLVRRYAASLVTLEETDRERDAARRRLFELYLHTLDAAVAVLCPQVVRLPLPGGEGAALSFPGHTDALAWLENERANLAAAIGHAGRHGPRELAWLLADRLRGYFWISRRMSDWLACSEAGLGAATMSGDLPAQAASHLSLGIAHRSLGSHERATGHLRRALALSREVGWLEGQASAMGSLGIALAETGRNRAAAEHFTEALVLNRRMGRRAGEAVVLGNLGNLRWELGELLQAFRDLTTALHIYRETRSPGGEAITLCTRGRVLLHLGRLEAAEADLTRSQVLHDEINDRYGQPLSLASLGAVHCAAGRPASASRCARKALAIASGTGDRRAQMTAVTVLGDVALRRGACRRAIRHYLHALSLATGADCRFEECLTRTRLADAYLCAGDLDGAAWEAATARELAREAGFEMLDGLALTVEAGVLLARGATAAVGCATRPVATTREPACGPGSRSRGGGGQPVIN
jgi:DNA-binding SARP family transcriptional activator/tetratricopeptide (TPR) repeat protein